MTTATIDETKAPARIVIDGDIDVVKAVLAWPQGTTLREALASLHLNDDGRIPDEGDTHPLWYHFKLKEQRHVMRVGVNVPECGCSGDCCGHLCRLSYDFTILDGHLVAIEDRGFNY